MFKKFKIKDIVFLAIMSTVLLIASGAIMPIVMTTNQFALRQVLAAPIFAIFIVIALLKIPKIGSITIIGILTGTFLLMMAPMMFFNNILGAVITELLVLLIFKNYSTDGSKIFAATIYMPLTVPTSLIYTVIIGGVTISEKVGNSKMAIIYTLLSIFLGFLGSKIGLKIGKELEKAGKLKTNK